MKKFYAILFSIGSFFLCFSQTPVPIASQPGLSYTENFSDISNWSPGFTSGTGANHFGAVAVNTTGAIPDGVKTTTSTATFSTGSSGGVQKGTGNLVLLSTGTADNSTAVAVDFFMDFTGVNAGTLSFDWATVFNSTGNRNGSMRVYYSTNGTTFTELTAAQVLNFTNNVAASGSVSLVNLPAAFNNSSTARLRFYYHNGTGGTTGSRPKISIDNLTITAAGSSNTIAVSPGSNLSEPATDGAFTLSLSAPAPAGGVVVNYSLSGSANVNADFTDPLNGSATVPEGSTGFTIPIKVLDDHIIEPTETITITLTGATAGYTASGSATINLTDNDVNPFISLTSSYTQRFDTLATSGTGLPWTDNATIPGWYASRTVYNAGAGASNAGALYSFGTGTSSERALGSVGSGSTGTVYYGARFKNNSGNIITRLKITYRAEQWRNGGTGTAQVVNFAYQTGSPASITSGTWINQSNLSFSSPVSNTTAGALVGNDIPNYTDISYTITGLNIAPDLEFMIRWEDIDHNGADDGLAIDDFTIEANPVDLTAPLIAAVSPANNATDVAANGAATITFDEAVQLGSGNIFIKRASDNSIFRTLDVASGTVSGNSLTFPLSALPSNTSFYVEAEHGIVSDLSGNAFAGIAGNSTWTFTTGTLYYDAAFQTCSSSLADGFTQYSQTGDIVWGCTTFGRDPSNAAGTAPFPYGIQINGFAGGTNVPNVDWLISPSIDLTGTTYPLLSFWSRTAFNGLPLQLKISTDYTGGDPALATWTDINGKFPSQTSNIWTLSSNINLAAFRQANVHFAFVYTSSDDDGARWTVDDIRLDNSMTPPPPALTLNTNDLQFGFVANGSSADKTFTVTGNDITGDITLSASSGFLLSKDGSTFSSSILFAAEEANNNAETVTVRFSPDQQGQNFTGTVNVSTSGLAATLNLKGTSIDPATTLEIVNWNVEWFGSTVNGPTNDDQQEQNIRTILKNVGADVYALAEVVSEERLARVVSQMPGYSYVISNYGSHTNTTANPPGALAEAQKLAFIYKTSVLTNISTAPLLSQGINSSADLNNPAYNYWASGRFPFMMTADVTLNCVTKNVRFILVHAKANTSPTNVSYNRRKAGADTLYQTLNALYPDDRIIILGDFNDDLDQSITAGFTTTSWESFTTDVDHFTPLTLPLSLAGKKSTVSYNDVIDHVIVSNEMQPYYMSNTATVLNDVSTMVSNYGATTTDHYPVFTRYAFERPAPPAITSCPAVTPFCASMDGNYQIPVFAATSSCGNISYYYVITGATERSGSTNDASGHFNAGTSIITWTAKDGAGGISTCQTNVVVNELPNVIVNSPVKCANDPAVTITATPGNSAGSYSYSWTVPAGFSDPGNIASFTTSVAGKYSVTLKNVSTGCIATSDGFVTVNPNPVVRVISATKCAADAASTMSAATDGTGVYSYNWSVPSGATDPGNKASFPAMAEGTYTVVVTDQSTGCATLASGTLTVNTNPVVTIPDASALSAGTVPNTVYIGYVPASSLTLIPEVSSGIGPYSYSWSNGSTSANVTVSPASTTVYSILVTDANGCTGLATKVITVKDITGSRPGKVIICHKSKNTLNIYSDAVADHLAHGDMLGTCSQDAPVTIKLDASAVPNPSSSQFIVSVRSGNAEKISMKVVDAFGRTVEVKDSLLPEQSYRIGDAYRVGIYFVMITQGNSKEVLTLVKL